MSAASVERAKTASIGASLITEPPRLAPPVLPRPVLPLTVGHRTLVLLGVVSLVLVPTIAVGLLVGAHPWAILGCGGSWAVFLAATEPRFDRRSRRLEDLKAGVASIAAVATVTLIGGFPRARALDAVVMLATAACVSSAVRTARRRRLSPRRVVLVGGRPEVEAMASELRVTRQVVVAGACVIPTQMLVPVQSLLEVPTIDDLGDVSALVSAVGADAVMTTSGGTLSVGELRRLSWALERSPAALLVNTPLAGVATRRVAIDILGGRTVLQVAAPRRPVHQRIVKAAFDRLLALLLILVSLPVLVAMWVAVRCETPGSGFFVQTRVGRDGRRFEMFKMRTMCDGAEDLKVGLASLDEGQGALFKIRSDPRVTRVGRLLRKSSLDELPQLFNVLRGEMSLVGPRPALPDEVATYTNDTVRRLSVKPGLTGLWQVSGRSDLTWEESVRLDVYYADNWSVGHDVAITLRTVAAVLRARGAY